MQGVLQNDKHCTLYSHCLGEKEAFSLEKYTKPLILRQGVLVYCVWDLTIKVIFM